MYHQVTKILNYSKRIAHLDPNINKERSLKMSRLVVKSVLEAMNNGKIIIYIDETSFGLSCKINYGYSQKGKKCVKDKPFIHTNRSMVVAVSSFEIVAYQLRVGAFEELSVIVPYTIL